MFEWDWSLSVAVFAYSWWGLSNFGWRFVHISNNRKRKAINICKPVESQTWKKIGPRSGKKLRDSDFVGKFDVGTKLKIPFEIKPPLSKGLKNKCCTLLRWFFFFFFEFDLRSSQLSGPFKSVVLEIYIFLLIIEQLLQTRQKVWWVSGDLFPVTFGRYNNSIPISVVGKISQPDRLVPTLFENIPLGLLLSYLKTT